LPNIIIWNLSALLGVGFQMGKLGEDSFLPIPIINSIDTVLVNHTVSVMVWVFLVLLGGAMAFFIWTWTEQAFFAIGFTDNSVKIGKVLYYLSSFVCSSLFFFLEMLLLAYSASGWIDYGNLGYLGVHQISFAFHALAWYAFGGLLVAFGLSVLRFQSEHSDHYGIIKEKVHRSLVHDTKKGSRRYESD
jgi:hypothetical protein